MKRSPRHLAALGLLGNLAAAPALAGPPIVPRGASFEDVGDGLPDAIELRDGPRGAAEPPAPAPGPPPESKADVGPGAPTGAGEPAPDRPALSPPAPGADAAAPPRATPAVISQANYLIVSAGTTLLHHGAQGSLTGPLNDASSGLGYGRFVTDTIALEIIANATFAAGPSTSFDLTPGAMVMLTDNVYAGGWAILSVRPKFGVALATGVGGMLSVSERVAVFGEVDLVSALGRGGPDAAVALTGGAFYSF
jgi:hypothetical protein